MSDIEHEMDVRFEVSVFGSQRNIHMICDKHARTICRSGCLAWLPFKMAFNQHTLLTYPHRAHEDS